MTIKPCWLCGKSHHGDIGLNCNEIVTRECRLKDQVGALRFYLGIEHEKISDAQNQAKNILDKLSQVQRHLKILQEETYNG